MYESSGLQFLRTTTGIQLGLEAFDKSRLFMTFLTILGVTEISCSVRLVLEGRTGIEILESSSSQKSFQQTILLIRWRRQHLQAIEQRRYSRFTYFENTISNLQKVLKAKFLGSDRLFCFIGRCNFSSSKDPFSVVTSLSELYFRFRRFILLVQMKKVISMSSDSSTSR